MSFQEITGKTPSMPVSADDYPKFLFSDVTSDCLGLFQLGNALHAASGHRSQVYLWHDPLPSEAGESMDTYAEKIANEIERILPHGPVYIGGVSWGGSIGRVVADKLIARGRQVALYVVDTPSIEGSQIYLQVQNPAATQDLISIFNYMSALVSHHSGQTMTQPEISGPDFEALCQKPFEEQIAFVKELFIKAVVADKKLHGLMVQYAAVVTQRLSSLLRYKGEGSLLTPLKKIGLFLSEESQKKYSFDAAKSWETSASEGEVSVLPGSTHLSLIKDKRSCEVVAKHMATYYKKYFPPLELMTMIFKPVVDSNPCVDLADVFHNLGKSKSGEAKLGSGPSAPSGPVTLASPGPSLLASELKQPFKITITGPEPTPPASHGLPPTSLRRSATESSFPTPRSLPRSAPIPIPAPASSAGLPR